MLLSWREISEAAWIITRGDIISTVGLDWLLLSERDDGLKDNSIELVDWDKDIKILGVYRGIRSVDEDILFCFDFDK